jgi:hypothetical protein
VARPFGGSEGGRRFPQLRLGRPTGRYESLSNIMNCGISTWEMPPVC